MAQPITMPKFGQMTEESAIVEWRKKEGDAVARGDVLFTVETDKSVMEVEAFTDGVLLKIVVPAGVTVPVNTVVGFIGAPGEPVPEVTIPVRTAGVQSGGTATPSPVRSDRTAPAQAQPSSEQMPVHVQASPQLAQTSVAPAKVGISPRARALARRCAIDPKKVPGTGPGGRVTERDVRRYLETMGYARLRITPAALELARKENVDVLDVVGTGTAGRITVEDIRRAVSERPQPLSRMRQTIAARLTQSFTTQPHFYVTVAVDMTDLIAFRAELKAAGAPYTITDFVIQAVVLALVEHPEVNASTDGRSVRRHAHVNVGLAVAVEGGLVVPVLKLAERKSMLELALEAKRLAEKARAGKLTPDEMSGGTFTISNLGMFNVDTFHAIINTGEGAILAVASAKQMPVVKDGQIQIRWMMNITLSGDHRLIDGATGAKFLNSIKSKLEDIGLWRRLAGW